MSNSRNLADLLENDGDVKSGHLDNVDGLPSRSGHSGKFLTNDGTDTSWDTVETVIKAATAPSPVSSEGTLFYNTATDLLYVSNGTQWTLVSNSPPTTTGGTVTISAIDEGATFSYNLGIDFEDDVDTDAQLTYTLESGTMPSGCTLPTSGNTAFTGTASDVSSDTNYTWGIKATDTSGATSTQNYQQTISNVLMTATGGSTYTSGGYTYHKFISSLSGSSGFVPNKSGAVDVLIVAGGGGGGARYGGGGGAGGYISFTSVNVTAQQYSIVVGAGGAGATMSGTSSGACAVQGGNSSALGQATAIGGGRGGSADQCQSGGNGGSGGGAQFSGYIGGTGTSGQGNSGGNGGGSGTYPHQQGGGGGKSAAGENGNSSTGQGSKGGNGGNAHATWASITSSGDGGYFAGGGGGGAHNAAVTGYTAIGGSGGGGNSGQHSTQSPGQAGQVNTGGGGGGASTTTGGSSSTYGGAGGSGIVIIRYAV